MHSARHAHSGNTGQVCHAAKATIVAGTHVSRAEGVVAPRLFLHAVLLNTTLDWRKVLENGGAPAGCSSSTAHHSEDCNRCDATRGCVFLAVLAGVH